MSCPNCVKGDFLPGEPTGTISIDFQNAYFAAGPRVGTSTRTVILLTDVFGLALKNCKIMADELAKRLECDVWIPDYFNGKTLSAWLCPEYEWRWLVFWPGRPLIPLDAMTLPDKPGVRLTFWDWIKCIWTVIPNIPAIISCRPSVVDKRLESVRDHVR